MEERRFREDRRAATASFPGSLLRRCWRRWWRPYVQWRRRLPGSGIGGSGGGGSCTSAPATTSALAQVPPHPESTPHWVSETRGCSILPKRAVIARRRGSHGGPRGSGRGRAQGLGGSEEGADAGKGSGAGEQEKEEEERAEPRWPPRGWDV